MPPYDPYVYDYSETLINRPGVRDTPTLRRFENAAVADRARTLPPVSFTAEGYKAIHRHLFQDVYDWAGKPRSVVIAKGGSLFAFPDHIEKQIAATFASLRESNYLKNRSLADFSAEAAGHINALNRAHPFREGNGRIMRVYLKHFCEQAGHAIDITKINRDEWMQASREGLSGSPSASAPMAAIIRKAQQRGHEAQPRPRVAPDATKPGATPATTAPYAANARPAAEREARFAELLRLAGTPAALAAALPIYRSATTQQKDAAAAYGREISDGDVAAAIRTAQVHAKLGVVRVAAAIQVLRTADARATAMTEGDLREIEVVARAARQTAPSPVGGARSVAEMSLQERVSTARGYVDWMVATKPLINQAKAGGDAVAYEHIAVQRRDYSVWVAGQGLLPEVRAINPPTADLAQKLSDRSDEQISARVERLGDVECEQSAGWGM